jgi:hypothetical protein
LNATWGFAIAPYGFGDQRLQLLVGNFGDGAINVFDLVTNAYLGQLQDLTGQPLRIDGLWAMSAGNGSRAGSEAKLYFSAGPNNEADGLFGYIRPIESAQQGSPSQARRPSDRNAAPHSACCRATREPLPAGVQRRAGLARELRRSRPQDPDPHGLPQPLGMG